MPRREMWNIQNRAIKNFMVLEETLPTGRYLLSITTLQGVVIDRIEARDKEEAEHHLCDFGYERIPSFVAFEIDQESK